jgi:(p)ppGpp synthase/HD superfamily hydrolase
VPSLITQAAAFAIDAHGEQKRKYTGEPYWRHPARVVDWLVSVGADGGGPWPDEVLAAAWLHDVLEDTPVTNFQLQRQFGPKVAQLVAEVTNPSKLTDGKRAARKKLDREFLAQASPEAHSIKLADILDNTSSIVQYDPGFAKIYLAEIKQLLPVLSSGHPLLYIKANQVINP